MRMRIKFSLWTVVAFVSLFAVQFGSLHKLDNDWISDRAESGLTISIVFAFLLQAELISYVLFTNLSIAKPEHIRAFGRLLVLLLLPLMLGLIMGFLG